MRVVRRLLALGLVVGLLAGLAALMANVVLVRRLERIDGAFDGLSQRPPAAAGQTILMVGTRPGAHGADVPWLAGEQSVEAVMLVEVAPDGRSAEVESLPSSSHLRPVAAAGSADRVVAGVEGWSGRRVDHLMAIDWRTWSRLAEHNGVAATYAWGSSPAVQHEFIRRVLDGTLHQELRKRPQDLYRALATTVDGTAVDDEWSLLDLDRLLFSLRDLRSHAITYAMAQPG